MIWLYVVGWIVCGVLTYGFLLGYCVGEYPLLANDTLNTRRAEIVFLALYGPIGLIVVLLFDWGKHGLKF